MRSVKIVRERSKTEPDGRKLELQTVQNLRIHVLQFLLIKLLWSRLAIIKNRTPGLVLSFVKKISQKKNWPNTNGQNLASRYSANPVIKVVFSEDARFFLARLKFTKDTSLITSHRRLINREMSVSSFWWSFYQLSRKIHNFDLFQASLSRFLHYWINPFHASNVLRNLHVLWNWNSLTNKFVDDNQYMHIWCGHCVVTFLWVSFFWHHHLRYCYTSDTPTI